MKTLQYVLNNLHHPDGGFTVLKDADSEGEEGKYYLFTPEEIIEVLSENRRGAL